ncbi:MAG TPA: hypothetical protein PKH32_12075 [Verrucomicrobiota bacterium]|nr:hypothetical protein [Verrucomicrobiota bacterium]
MALVLVTLLLHHEYPFTAYRPAFDEKPAAASAPSLQPADAVPGAASHPWESNLSPRSFEWTNHSGSTSSVTSFLPGKAN